MRRAAHRHFAKFAGIGALGTGVHYSILVALVTLGSVTPVVASSVGALGGALTNYLLNYRFNYRSRSSHLQTGPRFMLIAFGGFLINALFMSLLANRLSIQYLLAQVITTAIVLVWTFSLNHLWTFGTSAPEPRNAGERDA